MLILMHFTEKISCNILYFHHVSAATQKHARAAYTLTPPSAK